MMFRCFQLGDHNVKTKLLLSSALLCLAVVLNVPGTPAQQTPTGKMRLSKVEFIGLERHSQEEALAASGLQIGQPVDVPTLEAAAQKLFDSGLFEKLSYRYRTNGNQAVVTFQTEEDKGAAAPVVFDNFVWFSEEELLGAVRRQVPSFAGMARNSATNGITKALQQLLQDRKMAGRVEYAPFSDIAAGTVEHVFSVEDVKIPICTVHFAGVTPKNESALIKGSRPLIGQDYKLTFVRPFAAANLLPVYRELGHLRARIGAPSAKLESDISETCKGGVSVTLPVEEGPAYSWGKAEWFGNVALSNPELQAALKMKPGELANGFKIDKGLGAVQETYGKSGYLTALVKSTPAFEDANQRVNYQVEIAEGPQYHMGMLTINGLPEDTITRLKSKWKLQPGNVYDDSYIKEFIKKEIMVDAGDRTISSELKLDRRKFIVDVTISLRFS